MMMIKCMFFILLLLVMITVSAWAPTWAQNAVEPKWTEFYTPDVNQPVSPNMGGVIGHVRKKHLATDNVAYWNQRKAAYDREIGVCRAVENSDQQVNCYMQLREIEYQKNTMRMLAARAH